MTKQLLLCTALLILANVLQAQVALGLTAGASFSSYKLKQGIISATTDLKVGFTAGLAAFIPLDKNLSIQQSLNFLQKGGIYKNKFDNTTNKTTFNYLEMPINLIYQVPSASGKFFIGAGPSLSAGLNGSYKITGMYEESGDVKFGSTNTDDLRTFEIGLNFLAGYTFKNGFMVTGNYNLGLSNLSNDDGAGFYNRYFALKLGYLFSR